jgi:zinc protease
MTVGHTISIGRDFQQVVAWNFTPVYDILDLPSGPKSIIVSKTFLRSAVLLALAACLGVPAAAAPPQEEPALPFPVSSYSLRNGLQVILSADHSLPIVSVVLAYRAGSVREQPGKSGLAYLLEHLMMFNGSLNVGPMQHISYINRVGGEPNASTTADLTYFYETVPSNQLGLVLWLESDRMQTLEIDAAKAERWKQSLLDDLAQRTASEPYLESSRAFDQLLFPDFAHNHGILGKEEDIRNLSPGDITEFHDEHYAPNNAVLVIAGDISLPKAKSLIEKYFETIPPGRDFPPPPKPRPPEKKALVQVFSESLAPYPAFYLGYRVAPPYSPDYYGLKVLDYLLLKGETSRLTRRLIKKDKLAFFLDGGIERRGDVAALKIFATSNTQSSADLCQKAILSEFGKLRLNPVSEAELDRAKNVLKRDYVSRFSSTLDRAMFLAEMNFSPVGLENAPGELERYLAVTPAALHALCVRYLMPENCIIMNVKMR